MTYDQVKALFDTKETAEQKYRYLSPDDPYKQQACIDFFNASAAFNAGLSEFVGN